MRARPLPWPTSPPPRTVRPRPTSPEIPTFGTRGRTERSRQSVGRAPPVPRRTLCSGRGYGRRCPPHRRLTRVVHSVHNGPGRRGPADPVQEPVETTVPSQQLSEAESDLPVRSVHPPTQDVGGYQDPSPLASTVRGRSRILNPQGSIYRDLQRRKKTKPTNQVSYNNSPKNNHVQETQPVEASSTHPSFSNYTYAQATANSNANNILPPPPDINLIMANFMNEFKQLINPLIALLTKVVSNILDKK